MSILELQRFFLIDEKPVVEVLNFTKAGEGEVDINDPRAQVEFPGHEGKYFWTSGNPFTQCRDVVAEYDGQVPVEHPFFWNPVTAPLPDNVKQITKEEFEELIK